MSLVRSTAVMSFFRLSNSRCKSILGCGAFFILAALASLAATLPPGFTETEFGASLSGAPTAMEFSPDGRLFICLQTGQVRIIKNGSLLATPFLSLSVDSSGERGLLGIAFDPNFFTNHYVYVYYTVPTFPIHNRVSRFTAAGDVTAPGSEVVILNLDNLSSATNHNGGALHFGPDGKLYIGVGENANGANAQTLSNLLGKVLRINSNGSIPTDNPFYNSATGNNRAIWAFGLRNPFTFAFQPGTTRMFINDVGESTYEEINDGIAGSNYGWPVTEGPTNNPSFRSPIYFYQHDIGCAIVGGAFYNPPVLQFPSSYLGKYFFADLCGGWIHVFNPASGMATDFASGINTPVDLHVGPDGALYYLVRGSGGQVFRVSSVVLRAAELDFNGDGKPDYVLYNAATRQTAIWYLNNNAFVSGAYGPTLPAGWGVRGVADFNGDSHPDYALFNSATHQTALWYLSGPTYMGGLYGPTLPSGWELVTTADLNGDNKPDYVLYNAGTHQTALWYLNNNLFVSGAYGPTLPAGWRVVGVADFDRDSHADYALFNSVTRQTAIWYLSGPTLIRGAYGPTLPSGWALVATADFNGDGHPDYVLYNANTRQTAIWYLNNNAFVTGAYGPTLPAGWSLVAP